MTEAIDAALKQVVDSLKQHPAMLVLVLLNLIFLAAIYFAVRDDRQANAEQTKQLLTQLSNAQTLLAKCAADK